MEVRKMDAAARIVTQAARIRLLFMIFSFCFGVIVYTVALQPTKQ